MKKRIFEGVASGYQAPTFDIHFVKVETGFDGSIGLDDLEPDTPEPGGDGDLVW